MFVSVETCQDGYLIEVRLDTTDPTFLVMQFNRDYKKVCTTYPEVSEHLWKLFVGENLAAKVPTIEDHGKEKQTANFTSKDTEGGCKNRVW